MYALLDEDDANHPAAAAWLAEDGRDAVELSTHNYVVVESVALVQRRLGNAAVRTLFSAYLPALSIGFIGAELHNRAASTFLGTLQRRRSFVDCVSFEYARDAGVQHVFAFDRDFKLEGFAVVP